jgi:signal peptidase I
VTDDVVRSSTGPVAGENASGSGNGQGGVPPRRTPESDGGAGRERTRRLNRTVIEWVVLVVAAVVIALVIKTFLFQAFYIPSESMVPTLEVGDRVLVNKLSYDLHDVHRGDIVVFESAGNASWEQANIKDLVKRVIGLPGETVTACQNDHVCINNRVLKEDYLPKGTVTTMDSTPPGCAPGSPERGCTVPAGRYFVMGDNRTRSQDARAHGPIKGSSIVGRVFIRIWPLDRLGFL